MSEENKRCPFCGNKDIDISPISGAAWCFDCHSVSNDVDRWNTRPLEDALQARVEALEAETQRQRDALYILEHMILAEHPIQIKCDDDEYFVYTDDGFFDHAEDFIGAVRKADEAWRMSALKGEVKE